MTTLISRWPLRAGCPPELIQALDELARRVSDEEPGTLMYLVHLDARPPLDAAHRPKNPAPPPVDPEEQAAVTFVERYADAHAFAEHVNGPAFTWFRKSFLHCFQEDPDQPGWPLTDTAFYRRVAAAPRTVVEDRV